MKKRMRKSIVAVLLAAVILSLGSAALAAYPEGMVRLVCPAAAGAPLDRVVRAIAAAAEKQFGMPVMVANREGGNGSSAGQEISAAPGDGSSMLIAFADTVTLLPHVQDSACAPEQFKAVGQAAVQGTGILCGADAPWVTFADFALQCHEEAGQYLVACRKDSAEHMLALQLAEAADVKLVIYPVNSDEEALNAVRGGVADLCIPRSLAAAESQLADTQLKLLGLMSGERMQAQPEVPTLSELGYALQYEHSIVLLAPAATGDAVLAEMEKAWAEVLGDPAVQEALTDAKMVPAYLNSADTMAGLVKQHADFGAALQKDPS